VNKMQVDTTTDESRSLRIQIPGRPDRYHVHVTIEWQTSDQRQSQWPPGWVESTAGAIRDPSFARQPQGEYEPR